MTLGLLRGIAAGTAAFLALYFGLKTMWPKEGAAALSFFLALIVYLAVGGGWRAFQRWLNGQEEPEIDGVRRYFEFTTDHKVVGIQYLCAAFFLFFYAGVLALIMRTELAKPGEQVLGFQTYNTLVGMHGIGMVVVALTAIIGGFGNYFVPLQIGAKDMAFPRLNALSFWLIPPAVLILVAALFNGGVDFGWTAYAPLSTRGPMGKLFFLLAFATAGFSSVFGAINLLVTILRMRAKGLTFWRLPIFVHSIGASSAITLIATSVVASSLFLVIFDRVLGTSFFDATRGGSALLYQHLFWFYSHPAVYIMVLPAFGLMLEILPVFARKPLFIYRWVVVSFWAIVVLSCIVWAHHLFTSGMWALLNFPFMVTTELISVPTGIVFLSALGTVWRGSLKLTPAFLFAASVVANFMIGGLTGIFLADVPTDLHMHDTLFVTAHFHFTIVGASIFALFAGFYFWFPKFSGKTMDAKWGLVHFWGFFLSFNATFIPMFWTGSHGLRRRVADYAAHLSGVQMWISCAAFFIFLATVVFLINAVRSAVKGSPAPANPWNGGTLEWTVSSPPPIHNFDRPPEVTRSPY